MKKTSVVIGLGRFGTAIASRLFALGNEVLAIDTDAGKVQHAEPFVTYAVIGDARDEEVLRSLGVNNYDCAVVAIGKDKWVGKTLRELNLRAKYGTNIIAIRDGSAINVSPDADIPLKKENVLVAVGKNEQLSGLQK